ncbi:helix-turn-helix domain-containing protein [Streptomyces sp. NPDC056165]
MCEEFGDICRSVWNTALEQRREYWRRGAWMNARRPPPGSSRRTPWWSSKTCGSRTWPSARPAPWPGPATTSARRSGSTGPSWARGGTVSNSPLPTRPGTRARAW